MRFNITKTINGLAGTIFFVCFCADSLMERLGPVACLFVTLALLTLAYSLLKLTDRMGRRYILIERAVIPLPLGMGRQHQQENGNPQSHQVLTPLRKHPRLRPSGGGGSFAQAWAAIS